MVDVQFGKVVNGIKLLSKSKYAITKHRQIDQLYKVGNNGFQIKH